VTAPVDGLHDRSLDSATRLAALATPVINQLSQTLGFRYPPAFILLLAFLGLCLISRPYSVTISRLHKHQKRLAQRLALID